MSSACRGRKAGFSFWTYADFSHLNPVLSTLRGKFSDSGRFWTHTQRLEMQGGTSAIMAVPASSAQGSEGLLWKGLVWLLDQSCWDLQEVGELFLPLTGSFPLQMSPWRACGCALPCCSPSTPRWRRSSCRWWSCARPRCTGTASLPYCRRPKVSWALTPGH